jgi:hypothetical protein
MRFLALFGVLIDEAAMMVHPPPPIKMGGAMRAVQTPAIFSSPSQSEDQKERAV